MSSLKIFFLKDRDGFLKLAGHVRLGTRSGQIYCDITTVSLDPYCMIE